MNSSTEPVPDCFGKEWDASASECFGGYDSTYVHPVNQGRIRAQCGYFQSCGARTQLIKQQAAQQQQQLIPSQALIRQPERPANFEAYVQQSQALRAEAARQAALVAPRPPTPPVQQFAPYQQPPQGFIPPGGVAHPAQVYQLNYQVPGYLTTPEERYGNEPMRNVLFREVIRAMFKALGHAIANFFDTRKLR